MLKIAASEKVKTPTLLVQFSDGVNNRAISFRVVTTNKNAFVSQENQIFEYLNKYWETLPVVKQSEIFDLYEELSKIFESIFDHSLLEQALRPMVKKLLSYHMLEHVSSFLNKTVIMVPPLEVAYQHSVDNQYTRERTYILSDYKKLVTLALSIRCMIPVWHEFLYTIKDQVGDQLKELFALYLLKGNEHFDCEAMNKLEQYITATISKIPNEDVMAMKAVSSDDYPVYLLAQIVVKKLCIGELSSADPMRHIVSFCYKSLVQKVSPRPTSPDKTIRDKKEDGSDISMPSDSQERSQLELYKQRFELSVGEISELEFSVRDPYAVFEKLCSADKELLVDSLSTCTQLLEFPPSDAQTTLLRWAMAPVISPRGIMYVPEPIRIRLMGVVQAVLYAQGFKYLALLSTARKTYSGESLVVASSDSRMGIRPEYVDRLIELYPAMITRTEKQKDIKARYHIFSAIDNFLAKVDMFNWRITASQHLVKEIIGRNTTSLPIIGDIRNEVARYVIHVGQRPYDAFK